MPVRSLPLPLATRSPFQRASPSRLQPRDSPCSNGVQRGPRPRAPMIPHRSPPMNGHTRNTDRRGAGALILVVLIALVIILILYFGGGSGSYMNQVAKTR